MRLIKLQFVRSQQILLGQIPSAPSTYMRQVNHAYHLVSPRGIPKPCMIKSRTYSQLATSVFRVCLAV